ncbi:hypothetical protein MAR_002066 [Mya arenaria]|uniref:B box-type domain-containing protein n=1 Tax=Mya arenaria TaxID=6604 RepID=A0ABY7FHP6_MYAAR|nr:hypothetical protein MAR_002066 [Mya arenaria]
MATGFSGSELHAGDFEYDFPCTECQKHGLNSEAVYFCQQCTRQFCGPCLKQHDQFYRGHPILGPRKRDLWGNVTSMCKLHPGEEMKVFCRDHRQTCCVLCLEELHRQCKQVKLLQHIAPKPTNQPESENNEKTTHNDELPLKLKERVATTKHDTSPVVTAIHNNRPYPVKEGNCFNVKLEHDRYPCRIYGITVLPSGEIVITDHYNCNVKLLSPNYAVMDHFSTVIQKPWDICAVSDNQVAACTEGREILFFNVKNSKLELDRKMPLDVCCYCIYSVSYMAGHLYLSSGHTLYQYTLAGQKVREINLSNGHACFSAGNYLEIDETFRIIAVTKNRQEPTTTEKNPQPEGLGREVEGWDMKVDGVGKRCGREVDGVVKCKGGAEGVGKGKAGIYKWMVWEKQMEGVGKGCRREVDGVVKCKVGKLKGLGREVEGWDMKVDGVGRQVEVVGKGCKSEVDGVV